MVTDTGTNNLWPQITGARSSYRAPSAIQVAYNLSTKFLSIDYGTANAGSKFIDKNTKFSIVVANNGHYINGVSTTQNGNFSGTSEYPLWIFDDNDAGNSERPFIGRIYSYKISEGDTLKRYFVPAKKKSTNEIGLYDMVNNQFYQNSGSGSFTGQ